MKRFQNILVSLDTRHEDQPILESAAETARTDRAKLTLVDVVAPMSWMTRLLVPDHEHIQKLTADEKQQRLDELAGPLRDSGLEVETKVLRGKTSTEIVREVLRNRIDLVMRVAKGSDSRRKGTFGTTGTRLLRECPCTVQLVASAHSRPTHVLAGVDTTTDNADDAKLNEEILDLARTITNRENARLSIVHAWTIEDEQLLDGRMPHGEYELMKKSRQEHVEKLLNQFLHSHGCSTHDHHVYMLKGEAIDVIPSFAESENVDLVVIGTIGRSGAAGLLIGNTAEQILDSIQCSVAAVKPPSFVSPIKTGGYVAASKKTVTS
ncbi:MAG: universal stress protein [Rubripirellula sp.]